MKSLKLFLDDEEEDDLNIGFIRLSKNVSAHEFFFEINRRNAIKFARIKDICQIGQYYEHSYSRYEAYDSESQACIQVISNQSVDFKQKKAQAELFSTEEEVNYLLPFDKDVDYLIKTSDNIADFSLILWPEIDMFPIQNSVISSDSELFDLIQYYE